MAGNICARRTAWPTLSLHQTGPFRTTRPTLDSCIQLSNSSLSRYPFNVELSRLQSINTMVSTRTTVFLSRKSHNGPALRTRWLARRSPLPSTEAWAATNPSAGSTKHFLSLALRLYNTIYHLLLLSTHSSRPSLKPRITKLEPLENKRNSNG